MGCTRLPLLLLSLVFFAQCARREEKTGRQLSAPLYDDECNGATTGAECVHPPVSQSCADGWCKIPRGCFVMGSPQCEWGHAPLAEIESRTTLTHDFLIKQTEVTQDDWTGLGLSNPSRASGGPRLDGAESTSPVGNVTWFEAVEFANRLSAKSGFRACYVLDGCVGEPGTGMRCAGVANTDASIYDCEGFRLPTEAEWEYAARAGTRWATYAGDLHAHADVNECSRDDVLESIAWYCANGGGVTHPVKGFPANDWGLYDVAGNAAEMTSDVLDFNGYGPSPRTDPGAAVRLGVEMALRGGSVHTPPIIQRSAYRFAIAPDARAPGIGFRLVRTLK